MNINFEDGSEKVAMNDYDPINPYMVDGFYEQNMMLRKPWFGNYYEDFNYVKVKT